MHILFAASECAPYIKTGGLGDVIGALPKALKKQQIGVSVVLPKFEDLDISQILSRLEVREYFAIWLDEVSHVPQEIHLLRFGPTGIKFVREMIENEPKMVSKNFPGYYLVEKQYVAGLQDDFSFLLLQNSDGEQQVVLAKQNYISGFKDSRAGKKQALMTSK